MHKWQLFFIGGFSLLSLSSTGLASDENVILPTNDSWGCTGLIQQGDANPPVPTNDLTTLKTCLSHCDSLYDNLGNQGRISDMLRGGNYCRKSLNNLYFASVAQTITDELNQQTKQQQAAEQQSIFEQMNAMIKKNQNQQQQNNADVNANEEPEPAHPQSTVVGPPDNVNW